MAYKTKNYVWSEIKNHFDPKHITTVQNGILFVFNCGVKSLNHNDDEIVEVYYF